MRKSSIRRSWKQATRRREAGRAVPPRARVLRRPPRHPQRPQTRPRPRRERRLWRKSWRQRNDTCRARGMMRRQRRNERQMPGSKRPHPGHRCRGRVLRKPTMRPSASSASRGRARTCWCRVGTAASVRAVRVDTKRTCGWMRPGNRIPGQAAVIAGAKGPHVAKARERRVRGRKPAPRRLQP